MDVNVKEVLAGFIRHARLSGAGELESSFLEELVAGFDSNSKEARRAMRKLLAHDHHRFFCSACRILKIGVETAGRQYLMKLLLEGDLLLVCLADSVLFSLDTALDLAKVFVRLDPLLDFKLMQLLFRGDQAEAGEVDAGQAARVLDLVAGLPRHNRILPLLLKLLRFPNPALRSRAVLLFCQVSKNTQWVEQRLADEDPDVRASAVEGLWGNNTPGARALLREAARDRHYRVAANARVGLYLLDGRSAAEPLEELARHPGPPFRAAAALAMGRALDDRFLLLLNSMVKDVNAEVRSAALRALLGIRRKGSQPRPDSEEPALARGVDIKLEASAARAGAGPPRGRPLGAAGGWSVLGNCLAADGAGARRWRRRTGPRRSWSRCIPWRARAMRHARVAWGGSWRPWASKDGCFHASRTGCGHQWWSSIQR